MKPIFTILIALLLLGMVYSSTTYFCSDSDSGSDYNTKGVVKYGSETTADSRSATRESTPTRVEQSSEDYCEGSTLHEYYCDRNNQVQQTSYQCPYGCENGACLATKRTTCKDSDNGIDEYTVGTVVDGDKSYTDTCLSASVSLNGLTEYYCENNEIKSKIITCATGYKCSNGKCVALVDVPGVTIPTIPSPPSSSRTEEIPKVVCGENDGGKNIYTAGSTSGKLGEDSASNIYKDTCVSVPKSDGQNVVYSDYVKEYFCDLNSYINISYTECPVGYSCSNGACMKATCKDYDGGKNVTKQDVQYLNSNLLVKEECNADSTGVMERYCENGKGKIVEMLCDDGYYCKTGACVKAATVVPKSANLTVCKDSDKGKDYYSKGTTSDGISRDKVDSCKSATTLIEYYCNGTKIASETFECQKGYVCSDGACVKNTSVSNCTDTDNGDIYTYGEKIVDGKLAAKDNCNEDGTLTEWTCTSVKKVSCPTNYFCKDGACIKNATNCTDSDFGQMSYTKGTASNNGGLSKTDFCISDTKLSEAYCNGAYPEYVTGSCPGDTVCVNGACIKNTSSANLNCNDTDGGKVYSVKGTATSKKYNTIASGTDYCAGSILTEYYCMGSDYNGQTYLGTVNITCPVGQICLDGACVKNTTNASKVCVESPVENIFYEKRNVTVYSDSTQSKILETKSDACYNKTAVMKYFCDSSTQSIKIPPNIFDCGKNEICSDGACIKDPEYFANLSCIDTDNGKDLQKKGIVYYSYISVGVPMNVVYPDTCYNATWVLEQYCYVGMAAAKAMACPTNQICLDGACIKSK